MKKRTYLVAFLVFILLFSLFGCSGKSNYLTDANTEVAYSDKNNDVLYGSNSGSSSPGLILENRKLVKTIFLQAETEDMTPLLTEIERQIAELDGYVEQRNVYNGSAYGERRSRSASLVIRIPANQVSEFVTKVSDASNLVYNNEQIDDITLAYVDTESHMKALETEQSRLLELMEKADNMSDLLEIEARLTEVRYELESITSQLRVYNNLVDYATVNLEIDEVQRLTPVNSQSVWQRMSIGFVENLKSLGNGLVNLLVLLVAGLPYLVLIAVLVMVIVLLIKLARKKKRQPTPPFATGQSQTEENHE